VLKNDEMTSLRFNDAPDGAMTEISHFVMPGVSRHHFVMH
jgi:hypothetical protein